MSTQGVFHWMQACVLLWLCSAAVTPADAAERIRNYYDILNVEQTATKNEIKKSFRKLAVRYHPDKNKSTDAEVVFREIAEAYSVLSDKDKRSLYDSMGHKAFLENEASVDPEEDETSVFDFSNTFHDIFFTEESHFHWSFVEDEEVTFEHYTPGMPDVSFYFEDIDENEEEYLYYV